MNVMRSIDWKSFMLGAASVFVLSIIVVKVGR